MTFDNFNFDKQHTIASVANFSGKGLHTGQQVDITLRPANPGFGIQFQRVDLPGKPTIKADCDLVTDTSRGTTLQVGDAKIATIEHLLAALVASGIDNVLIEANGAEIPILDGSAQPLMDIIEEAGIEEQDATKIWYNIDENIHFVDNEKRVEMVAMPHNTYALTALIDFNSPVLGTQFAQLKDIKDFAKEVSPCRTFCFLHELETLIEHNLVKGGDLTNAIVVVDKPISAERMEKLATFFNKKDIEVKQEGYLNNLELRFPNEPARHKLLDMVGDLALIGYPIKGRILAHRPGHKTNVEFAKQIKAHIKKQKHTIDVPHYNPSHPPIYTSEQIEATLPHRYPFLLVDKIIELGETHIVGVKNVTKNEPFFQGHFPNNPVMPGVLQIEALAQTGGILCIKASPEGEYDTYFLKVDNCKFKQMVKPGDTLLLKMVLNGPIRRGICDMHGTIYVGDKIVTEADLVAQIVKRK